MRCNDLKSVRQITSPFIIPEAVYHFVISSDEIDSSETMLPLR